MVFEKRGVLLLAGAQALFQSASVLIMTFSGLIGLLLAPNKSLATLPLAMMMVATAAVIMPASFLMRRFGRRTGFLLGTFLGCMAGLLAAGAIWLNRFWLFVLANMLVGAYQAFAQYYRFAAVDIASYAFKNKAIAWVMTGGVVAAIAGPNIARWTQNIGSPPFVFSCLAFSALSLAALLLIRRLVVPPVIESAIHAPVRPLWQIIRQPIFLMALTSSAVGYGAMTMVMTATPLAMTLCGHTFGASATVIQWHVLGMFVPSFFTGHLIRRFGVLTIIAVGVVLLATQITIALTGEAFLNYLSGLMLLGVAWNFLFIGGTSLLITAYKPAEAAKVQAIHDFLIFAVVSLASFAAGSLLNSFGWRSLNMMVMPFLLVVLAMLFILRAKLRSVENEN